MKIKKGDKVKILKGKDRGKESVVERVWQKQGKVSASGVNSYKKNIKPRGEGQKGQIMTLYRPIPIANVALICPKCKQPTRIGYKLTSKEKIRVCRKCDQEI